MRVVPIRPKVKNRFQPGHEKYGGRKPGSENKFPRLLKEAIMMAAELEGMDGRGRDQLVGFLRYVAREDLRGFVMLMGRVLPYQIETKQQKDMRVEVTYKSVAQVREEMHRRGISVELVQKLMYESPATVDHHRKADDDDQEDQGEGQEQADDQPVEG